MKAWVYVTFFSNYNLHGGHGVSRSRISVGAYSALKTVQIWPRSKITFTELKYETGMISISL